MKAKNSLKPVGTWEVRRKIKIPALGHAADSMFIERTLQVLDGVRRVRADEIRHRIDIRYDATETDYQALLTALENAGFPPLDNWWSRRKSNWFEYLDTNARESANAPSRACCNKPPK